MTQTPQVGMGATKNHVNDSYPYTVIRILSARRIVVQADKFKRTDSNGYYTEDQDYEFIPNPDGAEIELSYRKDGYWRPIGASTGSYPFYTIGRRNAYRDPHI